MEKGVLGPKILDACSQMVLGSPSVPAFSLVWDTCSQMVLGSPFVCASSLLWGSSQLKPV